VNAFDRVLAEPASLAARYVLLSEWKARNDPRAALVEKQLAYRQFAWSGRRGNDARTLKAEINELIAANGRAWAGRVADLVEDYKFHRGAVAEIKLSGEAFLERGQELFSLAPIQHVDLVAPIGSIEAIAASPLLAKLSSLHIDAAGAAVGDKGAIALANSPHVANLLELSLWHDEIGRAGAEALAASPYLAHARYVGLVGNPADATPFTREEADGTYTANRPGLAIHLEGKFGPRPWLAAPSGHLESWLVERDELALIHDYVGDDVLAELEKLAHLTSRAKQLAKDVLEEMDKPISPEREAALARKEREDKESLERFYVTTGQATPEEIFKYYLAEMATAIECLNPPDGPFDPIELPLSYKGRKGMLRFAPSPNKAPRRYVELSIDSESGLSTSSAMLDTGTNAEIVTYLRRPELVAEMIETADERIVSLARNRLA
jgi:hypothetical protein